MLIMGQTKSATYWSQRKAKSSGKLVRWERLLTVLGNGGDITVVWSSGDTRIFKL
jgi:hypothetical protein